MPNIFVNADRSRSRTINASQVATALLLLFALLFFGSRQPANAAPSATLFSETFDDDSGFTKSADFFSDAGASSGFDFFGISDGMGGGDFDADTGTSPNVKAYTGMTGSFLTGMDLDGEGAAIPIEVTWTGIDITGAVDLGFSGDFAEFFDDPGDIDADDVFKVEYAIDGGSYNNLIQFSGADFSSGSGPFNGIFRQDLNFDGTGTGDALGDAAQNFSAAIAGTGSTLDLRLTVSVNSGDEDFAVDNFMVVSDFAGGGGGGATGESVPYADGFDDCPADGGAPAGWEVLSNDADTDRTWSCSTFSNVDVSSFGGTVPADDWLISPAINLDATENEVLSFDSYTRFTDINYPQLTVKYSTDYTGSGARGSATWTDLTGFTLSPEDSSQWTPSGDIDISGISGGAVYFAFQYVSSGNGSGSSANWRVDSFDISVDMTSGGSESVPYADGYDDCPATGGAPAGWTVVSVDSDANETWECSTFSNVNVSSFGGTAPADDWLISPAIDMDSTMDEVLSFNSYTNFNDINYPQLSVHYSTDYSGSGDPTAATWTALSGFTLSPEASAEWTPSGDIDVSGISGGAVYYAFQYVSSGTGSGTSSNWRVDGFDISVDSGSGTSVAKIHEIQGSGDTVTGAGPFTVSAIVVGDFQGVAGTNDDKLDGFFIQEEDADADADAATSEGIFVWCSSCDVDVAVGDLVTVTGSASDFFGMSQLSANTAGSVVVSSTGNTLPTPAMLTLPVPGVTATDMAGAEAQINAYYEAFEGMRVSIAETMTVSEYFQLSRFGQVVMTQGGRVRQYTDMAAPSAAGLTAHEIDIARRTMILDDDSNEQNHALFETPNLPVFYPQPGFSTTNFFRGGDTVDNMTGVLHWSFPGSGDNTWRMRPTDGVVNAFNSVNVRQNAPSAVDGSLKVTSFNVLNYFTTFGVRGADSQAELDRQTAKIVSAICAMDADVAGVVEIENNATAAMAALTTAINAECGQYDFVDTGVIGGDQIKVGFIYKTSTVSLVGDAAVLDTDAFTDPLNTGEGKNRPAVAQTFEETATGGVFTAVVNHFKSKGGSGCADLDCAQGDGQAQFNATRTAAANELAAWLATDPTGSNDSDVMILGDLNAYRMEDPLTALAGAGYTDLIDLYGGADAYSFVFDGQVGYLDHALANESLLSQVKGATEWHINADEVNLFDYNDDVQDTAAGEPSFAVKPNALPIYAPDAFRSSDHDPVVVGLDLAPTPVVSTLEAMTDAPEATGDALITVTLDAATTATVTVEYSTTNGTAIAPGDYVAAMGTLTFAPGETSKTIMIDIVDDTEEEGDETFMVTLSDPQNAELPAARATEVVITIKDNDTALSVAMSDSAGQSVGATSVLIMTMTVLLLIALVPLVRRQEQ